MTTPTNLSDLIDEVKSLLGNPDDSTLARIDIPFFLADNNYNKYYAAHAICSRLAAQDLVQFPERESAYIALGLQILSNYNRNKRSNPSPSPTNITVDKSSVYQHTKEILEAGSNVSLIDDDPTETITIASGGGVGGGIVDRTTVYPIAKQIVVAGTDIDIATDNATETLTISSTTSNVQSDWAETDPSSDTFIDNKPTVPSSYAPVNAEANVQSDWNETDASSDDYIKNKPTVIGGTGEANVQSDWAETDVSSDTFIDNKPTVPSSYAPVNAEANVQSNWRETNSGSDAYIRNKPDLQSDWNETSTSADDYIWGKPIIPSSYAPVNAEANVQSDWNESRSYVDDYIKNKPTVPSSFAPVNAEANVQSDWNETDASSDAYIDNKPSLYLTSKTIIKPGDGISISPDDSASTLTIAAKDSGGGSVKGDLIATWTFRIYVSYLAPVTLASNVPAGYTSDNTGNRGSVTIADSAILNNQVGWWLVWEDKGVEQHSYFIPLTKAHNQSLLWPLFSTFVTNVSYQFLQNAQATTVDITDIKTVPDISRISDQTTLEDRLEEQTVKLYPATAGGTPVSRILKEISTGSETYAIHPNDTLFHVYKRYKFSFKNIDYDTYRVISFFRSLLIDSGPPVYFTDSENVGCAVSVDTNILTVTNTYIDTNTKQVSNFEASIASVHAL